LTFPVPGNDEEERHTYGKDVIVATALWIAAVILVIVGIVFLIQGAIVAGIIAIVLGLLVGPGGVSIAGGARRGV
jgi:hypothetical protein